MNADNSRKDIFQNNLYKQTLDNLDNDFNSSDISLEYTIVFFIIIKNNFIIV